MNDSTKDSTPKFELGRTLTTPGVLELDPLGLLIPGLLQRHQRGDWGNVPPEDAAENELSLREGFRIISSHTIGGEVVWIITEEDRSSTTVLLPSEY